MNLSQMLTGGQGFGQGSGFGQALQAASPLLLSMASGMQSGNPYQHMGQGILAMQLQQAQKQEEEERKRQEEAARAGQQQAAGMLSNIFGQPQIGGAPGGFTGAGGISMPQTTQLPVGDAGGQPFQIQPTGGRQQPQLPELFAMTEQQYGLPRGYLERTAQIESSGNPNARNPNSSAKGLFQFIDSTAQQYGVNPMDPASSTEGAARLAADNAKVLRQALGREPTAAELYLAHQQGAGGAAKLLSNPNARAVDIVGADAVRLNGGNENMTAGQFAQKWTGKFGGQQQQPQIDPQRGMQILQSPYVSDEVKKLVLAQMQQQMQPQEPNYDQYRVVGGELFDLAAPGGPTALPGTRQAPSPQSTIGKLRADLDAGLISEEQFKVAIARMAPQGMAIESTPDGGFRMVQGSGVDTQRPFTEGQSKDITYSTRAQGALPALDQFGSALTNLGQKSTEAVPFGLGNYMQSPEYQQGKNAGLEFLQAVLRKDTGAAITREEQQEYGKVYLPEPGDSPQVLEQKRQARHRAVAAMEAGMPPAAILAQERAIISGAASADKSMGLPPPAAGTVEDGYRFTGGDPADPNSWQKVQ